MNKLVFNIDSYEVIMDDPSFMVLSVDIMSDGINRNGSEFLEEDMIRHIPKLFNKPINCIVRHGDFSGHAWTEEEAKSQFGVGTFPETNDVKVIEKNGKKYLRANAIIWKYLYPEVSKILKERGEVSVSMEIMPKKVEKMPKGILRIREWSFEAVTLLGKFVKAGIEGAEALVVKYSEDVDYYDDVMIKYCLAMDKIIPTDKVVNEINNYLSSDINEPMAIKIANNLNGDKAFTYSELKELYNDYLSLDTKFGGEIVHNWFNAVINQKEGGNNTMDKIKEALMSRFSGDLEYFSHDGEKVICFDYTSAEYKSFNYTVKEIEDEKIELDVSEEGTKVYKLKDSEMFAEKVEDGAEIEIKISVSMEKLYEVIKTLKDSNLSMREEMIAKEEEKTAYDLSLDLAKKETEELKTSFEEVTKELESVKLEKENFESKIDTISELQKELTDLRNYKTNKEDELKKGAINALYSKYNEFLTKEELESLNEKAKDMTIEAFSKEVSSIVVPKMEIVLESLKQNSSKDNVSENNLQFTSLPNNASEEEEIDNSLLGKLGRI
jgi:hypothetical protein